jgi:hypothetical protein
VSVLYGVLTGLDYTRFGTIVELLHNVTELYLAVASFGYDKYRYQWTIVASTALFMIQSIPILRLSIKEQFNWAVVLGTAMHYVAIVPLIVSAVLGNRYVGWLVASMLLHFTYDLTFAVFEVKCPQNCRGPQPYRKQFFLIFCNIVSIWLSIIFMSINKAPSS